MNTPVEPEFRTKKKNASRRWLWDGRIALGIMLGLIFSIAIWLLLDMRGNWFSPDVAKDWVPSLAAVVIAAVSLLISFFALNEQTRMRQAGTDPVLIAHLDQCPNEPMLIELKISNVGSGAAMNVRVVAEVPSNAAPSRLLGKPFEAGVLQGEVPLKVILQGGSVSYSIGGGPQLLGDDPLNPFRVKLTYQDIEGNQYQSEHGLDVLEFLGRSANSPPITKIWRELEKIRKSMNS